MQAWQSFVAMGARPAAETLQQQLRRAGRRDMPRVARPATQSNPFQLTARELEVLTLLCKGLKNSAIAGQLVRSVRTVDHHLAAIYVKLGVATRSEAVAAALLAGIGSADRGPPRSDDAAGGLARHRRPAARKNGQVPEPK